jgi:Zn-dependent protease with chaperone function
MSPAARAAIALALMAGFYVLAIGSGVGLMTIAWLAAATKSAAGFKVAFFCAIAGGTVLWSLRPRVDHFEPPGPELTRETQPELFGVIDEVARATRQDMPQHVYALTDVNAWVSTRGGLLGVGGRRVMGLGIPLLHLLTVDQLKAVLAHEFGHYGGGDTKIGRLVYHTRLGLGRTLMAINGKAIAVVFNAYGKLVMRVSTAVARQQEFAADRFAAQATSGQDLAASLKKLDNHGGLFPLFYFSNIAPVVEEGYWAPVGEGFSAFCASPMFVGGVVTRVADEASTPPESTYDSHPSTSARVAAIDALGPETARTTDMRVAGTLLRDATDLDFQVFQPRRKGSGSLKRVAWTDVSSRVLVPRWQRVTKENAHLLKSVRIESPPTSTKDVIQLGRIAFGLKAQDRDHNEVANEVLFAIGCGVATRLMEIGWAPRPSPSFQAEFARGDERMSPIMRIFEISQGLAPVEEWAAFCQKEGLNGPLAS